MRKVYSALPNSRIVVNRGQQQTALNTAPDRFIKVVLDFSAVQN
jgi:hypothetical protein